LIICYARKILQKWGMINYMQRSKTYYAKLGYAGYKWAHFTDVPFISLKLPIIESRLTLVTTAAPFLSSAGNQGPNAPYNAEAKFFAVTGIPIDPEPDLRISHLSYDRTHCAANDRNTWLPINALRQLEKENFIGELSEDIICLPTNRSQRKTIEEDCPAVVRHCQRLGTDVALLVPT
jgi:hypothetical protein